MLTIILAIVIAWLIITAIPFVFWAVAWAIYAITERPPEPPRRPQPPALLRKALLPSGRKGVMVYALLYALLTVAAYFVLSHR